ncbi:MAG: aryl-sulfate sulfotransferase [Phycisphaerae bacterium]|nr:aryl-sulfate sulfotransferase [Phycisphaerae bacterium]
MLSALIGAALCLALGGCDKSTATGQAANKDEQAAAAQRDRLEGLPYVDSVDVEEDEADGVVIFDQELSCPGYNLYSVQMLSLAELIDAEGKVVNSWKYTPSPRWERAELLPNGDLLVVGAEPYEWQDGGPAHRIHDEARYVLRFNWAGELLWQKKYRAHHDIELTPDGKLLLLTFNRTLVPTLHPTVKVRDDQLTLLEQDGTLIESKSMLAAVSRSREVFPLRPRPPTSLGGPAWLDVFHSNSIEWMRRRHLFGRHPIYNAGNILVCFRHQDRIAVFNWERNEILWAWGEGELLGPHDAQVLDDGRILVFDNGLGRDYSRVVELDPLTEKIVWQYKAQTPSDFYTKSKGSAQRLPNGHTLIAESDEGRAFEVTPDGEVVWEFICPHLVGENKRAAIVRMIRYPRGFVDAIIERHGG